MPVVLRRDAPIPLHRQIETSIRDAIRAGRLPRGSPLPPSRVLAGDLGVSRGVVVEGYSPFKTTNLHDPVLTQIAALHGVDAARVVLRWHVQHEVVVIPKSKTAARIATNFDISGFELTDDEMRAIDGLAQ